MISVVNVLSVEPCDVRVIPKYFMTICMLNTDIESLLHIMTCSVSDTRKQQYNNHTQKVRKYTHTIMWYIYSFF